MTANELLSYVERAGTAIGPIKYILEDPALPQAAWYINRLHALEQPKSGSSAGGSVPGIGLKYLVPPLSLYTKMRSTGLPPIVIAGLVVGGIFMVGYLVGKKR